MDKKGKAKKKGISSNWLQIASQSSGSKRKLVITDQDGPARKKQKLAGELPEITSSDKSITKYIALDCEMVGVGVDGKESVLARVVIVNSYGNVIFDKFCRPEERITDFRTNVSGVLPEHLREAPSFDSVQKEVSEIIENRIVVGHGLENDFKALLLSHPFAMTRDTAKYRPLQRKKNKPHSLKWLARTHLELNIQSGEHEPDVDARTALLLYNKFKKEWEAKLKQRSKKKYTKAKKKKPVVTE